MIDIVTFAVALAVPDLAQATGEARRALTEGALTLRTVEHCAANDPRLNTLFDRLLEEQVSAQNGIEAFLGSGVRPQTELIPDAAAEPTENCADVSVAGAEARFEAAKAQTEALTHALSVATDEGAWLGIFPLCEATVRSAEVVRHPDHDEWVARVRLSSDAAIEFNRYTEKFASENRPYARMTVRVAGTEISKPFVWEAVQGELYVSGRNKSDAQALVQDSSQPCGKLEVR
ncbi:MAG: hypothetical protein KA105_07385 [Caulobacter sp.]|nr:hypothetical protein [Caulobacter sp.]